MADKYIFGVDIGGTTVKIGLFTDGGKILDKWEIPTDVSEGGMKIPSDIAASIEEKISQGGLDKKDIAGIGMGVPGPVTEDGVVNRCVNLGWGVINIEKLMSELTGLRVKAGNDANVAALGEMWQGGGKGFKNIVMITLGTGVGGGIIINGRVVYGANGSGGEIGHTLSDPDETETCGCGNKGCLEQYCSATGVVKTAKKLVAKSTVPTLLREENITAKDVFDAAKLGDKTALEVLEDFGEKLGRFAAAAAVIVDPEVFLFGGGVSKAGEIVTETVKKYYLKYAFHATRGVKFLLADLGNDAGIYGGASLIINS